MIEKNKGFCNDIVTEEVSAELGLSTAFINDIIKNGQSAFIKETIHRGAFQAIRIVYLGKLAVKPKRVQVMNHLNGLDEQQRENFNNAARQGATLEQLIPGYTNPKRKKKVITDTNSLE
jgi:hypothetical protein